MFRCRLLGRFAANHNSSLSSIYLLRCGSRNLCVSTAQPEKSSNNAKDFAKQAAQEPTTPKKGKKEDGNEDKKAKAEKKKADSKEKDSKDKKDKKPKKNAEEEIKGPVLPYVGVGSELLKKRLLELIMEPLKPENWKSYTRKQMVEELQHLGDYARQYMYRYQIPLDNIEAKVVISQMYSNLFGNELRTLTNKEYHEENLHRYTKQTAALSKVFDSLDIKKFIPTVNLVAEYHTKPQTNNPAVEYEEFPYVIYRGNIISPTVAAQKPIIRYYPPTKEDRETIKIVNESIGARLPFDLASHFLALPYQQYISYFTEVLPPAKKPPNSEPIPHNQTFADQKDRYGDSLFTLLLVDLDQPARTSPTYRSQVQWLVTNIEGNNVEGGNEVVPYVGPLPSKNTALHRLVFLLFEQKEKITEEIVKIDPKVWKSRSNFGVKEMMIKHHLEPIGLSFYQSEWNERVSDIFKQVYNTEEPVYLDRQQKKSLVNRIQELYHSRVYRDISSTRSDE